MNRISGLRRAQYIGAFGLLLLISLTGTVLADPMEGSQSESSAPSTEAAPGFESAQAAVEEGGEEAPLSQNAAEDSGEPTNEGETEIGSEAESSSYAFANLSAAQEEALLQEEFPQQLNAIDADPSRVLAEVSLDELTSPTEALVTVGGEKMLLESATPIRAEDPSGRLRKVDLALDEIGNSYSPANPLVELELPAAADGPISIGERGLELTAVGTQPDSAARLLDRGDLFFPGAVKDSSYLLSPVSSGVELSAMLNSPDSPEQLQFAVSLPEGASLRASEEGGAEVVAANDEVLYRMTAPIAVDANEERLPATLGVEEEGIVINVPHSSADITYPIYLDPTIEENWSGFADTSKLNYWNWQWAGVPSSETYIGQRSPIVDNWGNGLYVRSRSNTTYPAGSFGRWWFVPQGSTTYFHRVIYGPIHYDAHGCTANEPHGYAGIWNNGGYWSALVTAYPSGYGSGFDNGEGNFGSGARTAFIGIEAASNTNIKCGHDYALNGATFYLDDPENPSITSVTGIPTGWTGSEVPIAVGVTGADPGLGVRRLTLHPQGQKTYEDVVGCSGHLGSTCPASRYWTLNLGSGSFSQGISKVEVSAEDALFKSSSTYNGQIKIDRSNPVVNLQGQLAEATKEEGTSEKPQGEGKDELRLPVYNLRIEASDGVKGNPELERSGMKSIEVLLDGKSALKSPLINATPCDSCTLNETVPVQVSELSPNAEHHLKVVAKDQVGNKTEREIEFEFIPATGIKDEYVLQRFPLPDGQDHEAEQVNHGPELAVNVMNGNLVYHERDVDIEGPNIALEVERFYNSQLPTEENTEWGDGWTLAQTPELEPESGSSPKEAQLLEATGAVKGQVDLPSQSGEIEFNPELQATITKEQSGYVLSDATGESGAIAFDAGGKAEELQTEGPAKIEYDYEGGHLSEIAVEDPNSSSEPPPVPPDPPASGVPLYVSSFGSIGSGNGQFNHPADVAIDPQGNLWIPDQYNNRVQEFTANGQFIKSIGSAGSGNGQFSWPKSLAFSPNGDFWVADAGGGRLEKFNAAGQFVKAVGSWGSGNGQFGGPEGIAIDAKGNIWVADTYNYRIQELNSAGEFIKVVNPSGLGPIEPTGIDVGPDGNVWVADWAHDRVVELSESGELIRTFGSEGTGNGQFRRPDAITVDSEGDIWVGDQRNSRIQEFNQSGEYLGQFGAPGSGPGQFSLGYPLGLATDRRGNLWIADSENNRIQKWRVPNYSTTFMPHYSTSFGSSGSGNGQLNHPADVARDSKGNLWVIDENNNRVEEFNSSGEYLSKFGATGSGNGQMNAPTGIATDSTGNVWVVEAGNHRVQEFTSNGAFVRKFGTSGTGNGQLSAAEGIAIAPDGNIWVADTYNARLQVFSDTGEFIRTVGSRGSEAGQFIEPCGLDVAANGTVFVADWGNNRVEVFGPQGEYLSQFGTEGSGNGQFQSPFGLEVDDNGIVWVAEGGNDRVDAFDENGNYLGHFGASGSGPGQFSLTYPIGIASDASGRIWVTDTGNNRVQAWATPAWEAEEEALEAIEELNDPSIDVAVSNGLVTGVTGNGVPATTYSYSADDLVARNGTEGETKYEYDSGGRMTKVSLPNGTSATIAYEPAFHRVSSVTVDPAGAAPAHTTHFTYSQEPLRTTVEPEAAPVVTYDIGPDGSILKSSNVVQPPDIEPLGGSLYVGRETTLPIEPGLHNLEVPAHSEEGVSTIEIIAGGNTIVSEQHCAQNPELAGIECKHVLDEWVVDTSELSPGVLQLEVLVEDRLAHFVSKRFWVNIPVTPPPDPDVQQAPLFSEVKSFREAYGLDHDLNPLTEEQQLNRRIFNLIGAWNNPNTAEGAVARASAEQWGVPLRPVDVAEMEYREWYMEVDGAAIEQWAIAHYPNVYGGYSLDNAAGGVIKVGFTQQATSALADLKEHAALVALDRISASDATPVASYATLQADAEVLSNEWATNAGWTGLVTGIEVDMAADTVRVGATNIAQAEDLVDGVLGAGAPVSLEFQPDAAEPLSGRNRNTGRILAGDRIISPPWACTAGFGAVEHRTSPGSGTSVDAKFALTAGHCFGLDSIVARSAYPGGQHPESWRSIGQVTRTGFQGDPAHLSGRWRTDAEGIRLQGDGMTPMSIFRNGTSPLPVQAPSRAHAGDTLCFSGIATNRIKCREVIATKTEELQGVLIKVYVVPFGAEHGDSGAPVWNRRTHAAVGLISSRNPSKHIRTFVTPLLPIPGVSETKAPGALKAPGMFSLNVVPGN